MPESPITQVLARLQHEPDAARSELLPLVYDELRKLANARMNRLPPGQTLQPTALVHEAYIALLADEDARYEGRAHFFGAAARAMRNLLVDAVRRKRALKRGGALERVDADLEQLAESVTLPPEDLISLDAALDRLAAVHPRKAQVVNLRYFTALDDEDIATILDVAIRTVERDWRFAKAWLHRELAS